MRFHTESESIRASRDELFAFIADPDNIPKWATTFCKAIEYDALGLIAVGHDGSRTREKIEADPERGTIDFWYGPDLEHWHVLHTRVTDAGPGCAVFTATFVKPEELADEEFDEQMAGLRQEMDRLAGLFAESVTKV